MKKNVGRKKVSGPDDLVYKVVDFLSAMVIDISLITSFFREKNVLYIN